jgi:hypothetical protein
MADLQFINISHLIGLFKSVVGRGDAYEPDILT